MTSHACKWLIDSTCWFTFIVCTVWLKVINNSKCQEFSYHCTLISTTEMMSECSKLMWNHKPQANGFIGEFWTFWLHFYGREEYRPWKVIVDLFFYHNIVSFDVYFCWTFSVDHPREKEKNKLCHPYSTLFTFSLIINNCWKAPIIFQIHIRKVHILIFNGSGMCKV